VASARPSSGNAAARGSPLAVYCAPRLTSGWLQRENAHTGLRVTATPDAPAAQLYLDAVSAVCGQVVHANVSAPAGSYRVRAVRVGWYGGRGARVVAVSASFAGNRQKDAKGTDNGGSPGWRPRGTLPVNASWPPGFYLIQLTSGSRVLASAPLVVQAPAGVRRAPELFVVAAMTWSAYTTYGGRSLYRDIRLQGTASAEGRARVVSVLRPMQGPGVGKLFRETGPLVRAVERAGVDLDYAADMDVDRSPSLLDGRAAVVTGSHTEYITRRVYDAFETARNAGTNLALLGGNQFYWQARLAPDATGRPTRMTVYRYAREDPLAASRPDLATVRWRDAPVRRPEARLLGAQYSGLGVVVPLVVLDSPAWLGWTAGRLVPAGAVSEVDAAVPGVSPPGTRILAAGKATSKGREINANVTYYAAASGAGVFDAASVFLGCTTAGVCRGVQIPAATAQFWSGTVVRIVRSFATPRFGAGHPASPTPSLPTSQDLLRRYGLAGVGTTFADTE
jgi:hypothetical protein